MRCARPTAGGTLQPCGHIASLKGDAELRSLAEVVDLEAPLPVFGLVLDEARALGGGCGLELLGKFGDGSRVLGRSPGGLVHFVDAQQAHLRRLV